MKINPYKRKQPLPAEGVTFHAKDEKRARDLALKFAGLHMSDWDIAVLRDSVAAYIRELETAGQWTGPETEPFRKERLESAFTMHHALRMAFARNDVESDVDKER